MLYVYSREDYAESCFVLLWTVIQGKEDYAVLARRENETLSWRETSYMVLNRMKDLGLLPWRLAYLWAGWEIPCLFGGEIWK